MKIWEVFDTLQLSQSKFKMEQISKIFLNEAIKLLEKKLVNVITTREQTK
jgi:hypothetical protein